jgi:hypothetical protein
VWKRSLVGVRIGCHRVGKTKVEDLKCEKVGIHAIARGYAILYTIRDEKPPLELYKKSKAFKNSSGVERMDHGSVL